MLEALVVCFSIFFPQSANLSTTTSLHQAAAGECSCGGTMVRGLCVKPSQGDALLFWSLVCDLTLRFPMLSTYSRKFKFVILYKLPFTLHLVTGKWGEKKFTGHQLILINVLLLLFQGLNGRLDPNTLHAGCPVLRGEKWSATKWMRESTLRWFLLTFMFFTLK